MPAEPGSAIVRREPLDIDTIQRVAKGFILSALFPDMRGGAADVQVAKAFTKIQAGQELGIPPFAAMRGLNIIEGKVELRAALMAALVKNSGRYRYKLVESSNQKCLIDWQEKLDDKWEHAGQSEFTIEEAQGAGLVKPNSGWTKYPGDMLFARSLSRGFRRFCPDLAAGTPIYVEGEVFGEPATPPPMILDDMNQVVGPVQVDAETGEILDEPATAGRRLPRGEPVGDVVTVPAPILAKEEDPDAGEMITEPQKKRLFALAARLGLDDEQRHVEAGVASFNDLTKERASRIIDEWEALAADDPEVAQPPVDFGDDPPGIARGTITDDQVRAIIKLAHDAEVWELPPFLQERYGVPGLNGLSTEQAADTILHLQAIKKQNLTAKEGQG